MWPHTAVPKPLDSWCQGFKGTKFRHLTDLRPFIVLLFQDPSYDQGTGVDNGKMDMLKDMLNQKQAVWFWMGQSWRNVTKKKKKNQDDRLKTLSCDRSKKELIFASWPDAEAYGRFSAPPGFIIAVMVLDSEKVLRSTSRPERTFIS